MDTITSILILHEMQSESHCGYFDGLHGEKKYSVNDEHADA
jgi:hypothetical protein